jgi:hypothetical protein
MKKFELLDKGNSSWLLTVTPTRVTIKIQSGESVDSPIYEFLLGIANSLEEETKSWRGSMLSSKDSITIYTNGKKEKKTFKIGDYREVES